MKVDDDIGEKKQCNKKKEEVVNFSITKPRSLIKKDKDNDLTNYKNILKQQISENKEKLRKLNLVDTFRKKV